MRLKPGDVDAIPAAAPFACGDNEKVNECVGFVPCGLLDQRQAGASSKEPLDRPEEAHALPDRITRLVCQGLTCTSGRLRDHGITALEKVD